VKLADTDQSGVETTREATVTGLSVAAPDGTGVVKVLYDSEWTEDRRDSSEIRELLPFGEEYARQPSMENLGLNVPWLTLAIIFLLRLRRRDADHARTCPPRLPRLPSRSPALSVTLLWLDETTIGRCLHQLALASAADAASAHPAESTRRNEARAPSPAPAG
jgi:hypothetical protein